MNYRSENLTIEQRDREYLADVYQHAEMLRYLLKLRQRQGKRKRA